MAIINSIIKNKGLQDFSDQIKLLIESNDCQLGLFELFWLNNVLCQVLEIAIDTDSIISIVVKLVGNEHKDDYWCTGQKVTLTKLNMKLDFIPSMLDSNMNIKIISEPKANIDNTIDRKYDFIPVVQNGNYVNINDKIGYVSISSEIKYWVLADRNGQITKASLNSFNEDQVILLIDNQPVYLKQTVTQNYNKKNIKNIKEQVICPTGIASIDIFYPILSQTKNLLINPPKGLIMDILNPIQRNFNCVILHLTKENQEKKDLNNPNLITIIDNIGIPKSTTNFVQNWCIELIQMGYNILLVNELGYILHFDEFIIKNNIAFVDILQTDINQSFYNNKIVWQGNDLNWDNSTQNTKLGKNLEKLFLEQYNIEWACLYQKLQKIDYQKLPDSIKKTANYPQTNTVEKLVNILNVAIV